MDRRSAISLMVASGATMLIPSVASAGAPKSKSFLIHVPFDAGDDRKAAFEALQRTIETAFVGILGWHNVVGLDLERNIKIELKDRSYTRPWLGKDADLWVGTEALIRKKIWLEGKELKVERLGGRYPRAEHLEPQRMSVFQRAVDLRLGNHLRESTGFLDDEKLRNLPIRETSANEYLIRRHDEWTDSRKAALKELGAMQITVPVMART